MNRMRLSTNSDKIILITGGTGFIGLHLVRAFAQKGYNLKLLVRKTSNISEIQDDRSMEVEFVYGDITNKASLESAVKGVQLVYHLAAQVGKWGIPDRQFYAVNVRGTQNLLEASLHAGVEQFAFSSTPGVQGRGYAKASEALPYNPPYIYERTKCEAEKLVLEFHRNRNLPVTIIRSDFVYGPGDLRRLPLYKAIRDKKFCIVGNGRILLHPTYIDDVIQGFQLIASNPIAFGEIYNIAGPKLVTVEEYVRAIAHALNVAPPWFKVPKPFAVAAAWASIGFSKISNKKPLISRSQIEFLTKSHGSNISKAKAQLGYLPKCKLKEAMVRTINWYYEHNLL